MTTQSPKGRTVTAALAAALLLSGSFASAQTPTQIVQQTPADFTASIQAATTAEQVNDLIAAASTGMTPVEIARLVAIAVAAHAEFATSIVSAASALHPEAVNLIAAAAVGALPASLQASLSDAIVIAAANGARVSAASVQAAASASYPDIAIATTDASTRDTLASGFAPTSGSVAPIETASVPDSVASEPPATDPSKGNSGSPA